ncbi:sialidase family protein [Conexibacter stalactiti]|uniref:exo-alpha-sialidase n=1 Tax=Conexibacter stalactiti TaxID=1940611 RepID=A0ABU4HZJ1_9ACTN|nr:sialidase family protein [Conexibacter stalactiti]MDW5598676.1 sialidase family protein [Conexibacter stalactiti]MEC5039318.1 sialidase family protein [Conexibacter stalactiti]
MSLPSRPFARSRPCARIAALLAAVAAATAAVGASPAAADPGLQVVERGWVTASTHTAFGVGAERAANGDILVTYNTDGDSIRGASVWLTRSTDEGRTWSTPTQILRPLWYANGSSNSALGITRLRDGTLLMAASESIVHTPYTDRESVTYILRSTDDGVTWSGAGAPIRLPTPMYYNATYGKFVELPSGVVLMPIWGAPAAPPTPGGVERATPWQSGVLRSFDGGRTFTDYRLIGKDDVGPPAFANPNGNWPNNVTETSIAALRDGRLLAVMRTDSTLNTARRYLYLSWSSDDGATWTEPHASIEQGTGHAVTTAPCTPSLPAGRTKLVMGSHDPATNALMTRVSYDGGVSWSGHVPLQNPDGTSGYSIYPDFVPLAGNKLLAVYGRLPGVGSRIAYNVIQDQTGAACEDELDAADAQASARPSWFLMRADRDGWPWPFGRRNTISTATNTISGMLPAIATLASCREAGLTLWKNGVQLSPTATLQSAGVVNGDTLVVRGTAPSGIVRTGWNELDRHPSRGRVFGWDTSCAFPPLGLDYKSRSLGLDVALRSGQSISSISLRDRDATTRLTAADYGVWTSTDNDHWTPVTGWTLAASTSGGRLTHTFNGLALTGRYVKISQRYADTAFTFVLDDLRSDVTVTVTP